MSAFFWNGEKSCARTNVGELIKKSLQIGNLSWKRVHSPLNVTTFYTTTQQQRCRGGPAPAMIFLPVLQSQWHIIEQRLTIRIPYQIHNLILECVLTWTRLCTVPFARNCMTMLDTKTQNESYSQLLYIKLTVHKLWVKLSPKSWPIKWAFEQKVLVSATSEHVYVHVCVLVWTDIASIIAELQCTI